MAKNQLGFYFAWKIVQYKSLKDFIFQKVRGYHMVKEGLKRRIIDIERERRRAQGVGDRKTLVKGPGTDQVSH